MYKLEISLEMDTFYIKEKNKSQMFLANVFASLAILYYD